MTDENNDEKDTNNRNKSEQIQIKNQYKCSKTVVRVLKKYIKIFTKPDI